MKSLQALQEELYELLEIEQQTMDESSSKNDSEASEIVTGLSFLILMIYGVYEGSIFILNRFPDKSWWVTTLLFVVMIFIMFIVTALLSIMIGKIVSSFTSSKSERIRKEIVEICSKEFAKKGMFTLLQMSEKTMLNQLDECLLQSIINELVHKGDLQQIQLNDDTILYKCLLASAQKNIKIIHHESP